MREQSASKQMVGPYDFFMICFCLFSLILFVLLAFDTFIHIDIDILAVLLWFDTAICIIFLFDFLLSLWRAENRWRYFMTWGWIDLLSSIPSYDFLRWGRAFRIFRIFRLMRGIHASRLLANFILMKRKQSAFFAVVMISFLVITFSSVGVLQFEVAPDSNIKGPSDAIWWSIVTLTTVGYGDRFPVTPEGRAIGAILMIAGIGLFGTLSGFIASWFLSPIQKKDESEIDILRREISELRSLILDSHERIRSPQIENVIKSKDEN
jgi:voltage-gated potassium channel